MVFRKDFPSSYKFKIKKNHKINVTLVYFLQKFKDIRNSFSKSKRTLKINKKINNFFFLKQPDYTNYESRKLHISRNKLFFWKKNKFFFNKIVLKKKLLILKKIKNKIKNKVATFTKKRKKVRRFEFRAEMLKKNYKKKINSFLKISKLVKKKKKTKFLKIIKFFFKLKSDFFFKHIYLRNFLKMTRYNKRGYSKKKILKSKINFFKNNFYFNTFLNKHLYRKNKRFLLNTFGLDSDYYKKSTNSFFFKNFFFNFTLIPFLLTFEIYDKSVQSFYFIILLTFFFNRDKNLSYLYKSNDNKRLFFINKSIPLDSLTLVFENYLINRSFNSYFDMKKVLKNSPLTTLVTNVNKKTTFRLKIKATYFFFFAFFKTNVNSNIVRYSNTIFENLIYLLRSNNLPSFNNANSSFDMHSENYFFSKYQDFYKKWTDGFFVVAEINDNSLSVSNYNDFFESETLVQKFFKEKIIKTIKNKNHIFWNEFIKNQEKYKYKNFVYPPVTAYLSENRRKIQYKNTNKMVIKLKGKKFFRKKKNILLKKKKNALKPKKNKIKSKPKISKITKSPEITKVINVTKITKTTKTLKLKKILRLRKKKKVFNKKNKGFFTQISNLFMNIFKKSSLKNIIFTSLRKKNLYTNIFKLTSVSFKNHRRSFNLRNIISVGVLKLFKEYNHHNPILFLNHIAGFTGFFEKNNSILTYFLKDLFIIFTKPAFLKIIYIFQNNLSNLISTTSECIRKFFSNLITNLFINEEVLRSSLKALLNFSFKSKISQVFFYFSQTCLLKFLEHSSSKKIALRFDLFVFKNISSEDATRCYLWAPHLREFKKSLGSRFFLVEALSIVTLTLRWQDPYVLSNWMLSVFHKMSFWKYKSLFNFIQFSLRYFFWPHFPEYPIKGLRFQLKGKVSVAGNGRTRTVRTQLGSLGHSKSQNKILTVLNLLRTFTGVIGFQTWMVF